jgi:molybdopterin synthase catalytic subunit
MAKRAKGAALPRVRLQKGRFNVDGAMAAASRPDCGAVLAYLGTVRSTPHGGGRKAVRRLEYEAFEKMAVAKLKEVRRHALARFEIKELILHHRVGNFDVGEPVVMCVVSAPHRDAALDAVRFAIAEMKQTVPIWKKEVFRAGGQRWVVGEMRPEEVVARPKGSR